MIEQNFIVNKKFLIGLGIILFILLDIYIYFQIHPRTFQNCTEMRAVGLSYVKEGDPFYNAALDRDKNHIACQ